MRTLFGRKPDGTDFSDYLGVQPQSRKRRLLQECEKHDVSIFVEDESEQSSGVYAAMRAVVSEAELERRLNAKVALRYSKQAGAVAVAALLVSVASLVKSLL